MKIFNIIYKKLINWLLPVGLRQPTTKAWLKVLCSPVIRLYGLFSSNRRSNLYRVKHGLHVAHLEAVLNDKYDNGFRRITVTDAPLDYQPKMVYKTVENKPVYLYQSTENKPEFIWTGDEVLFGGIDFVVNVPVSIVYDPIEMREVVKDYKTPGMGFIIQDV